MSYITSFNSFKNKYQAITAPGKYQVKVRSVSKNPVFNVNVNQNEYIVNFYAVFPQKWSSETLNYLKSAAQNGEVDVEKIPVISFNQQESKYLPMAGESVVIMVEKVYSKRQDAEVLAVTSLAALPISQNSGWSFLGEESSQERAPQVESLTPVEFDDEMPF